MESCYPPASMHRLHPVSLNSVAAFPPFFASFTSFSYYHIDCTTKYNRTRSSLRHLHRLFPVFPSNPRICAGRCHATSPGPPPPPKLEPPSGETPAPSSGAMSYLSKVQDAVRIFFAVFFWMSLFFWSSAWDGRNNGRPNKGPRSRR